MFEEFKNLYSLTKTISFDLIPTEITKKNMEKNNDILLYDLELNDKEYLIHDAFDKIMNTNNSNISNDLFADKLKEISKNYIHFKNDKNFKKEYEKYKKEICDYIEKQFNEENGNKKLFDEPVEMIKSSSLVHENIISMYTKGRIDQFIRNRKKSIKNISKRMISNIELMTNNVLLLEKIVSSGYVIEKEIEKVIKNFNLCLFNQEEIDKYNDVIASLNQKINEDYQKKNLNKKYTFIQLQKHVLSEKKSDFIREQYKSVNDVYEGFKKLNEDYDVVNIGQKLQNVFNNFEDYDLDNIFVKNNKLHDFSTFIYGNHNYISNKINEYANKNIKKDKDKNTFKKSNFSITEMNNIVGENIFEKIKIDNVKYKELFLNFFSCPIDSKEYFDNCLAYSNNVIEFFRNIVKTFDLDSINVDSNFNALMSDFCNFYKDFNKVFDCTTNFIIKRNDHIKSYLINWGNVLLNNPGWAETKIKDYRCCIFVKNNKYYFGYFIGNDWKFEITNNKDNSYSKMINMQLGDLSRQCPRMTFCRKEVKNHFDHSKEDYIFDNGFKITRELYDIYIEKKFNSNKESLAKYIDLFKNYFMNYYENHHYFDFSNLKESSAYNSLQDFYKDLSVSMYYVGYENISDKCIEKLQKENKLWLFRIYNQDFSEHKKPGSSKNIHTLIFETFFSEENKNKHYPIKLNGKFQIRYRDAGITDGFIHRKGSVLLNKNDKNGKRIPDSVYSKLFAYVNGKHVELNDEDKYYLDNDLLITLISKYDIIKDRRYINPKYQIYLSFTLNSNADNDLISNINDRIDEYVKTNKCYIIGIDRGERNLLCATVIDNDGKVIDKICLDNINNVNYNELMSVIEKDRKNQKKNWKKISVIKNTKKGFLSYAVKAIVDLVEKYNAVISLERLNDGFMQSRTKIEKSIYKEFVKQLINKLSYMVVNKKGSVIDVKQLAFNDCSSSEHNGIVYYVDPSYTSKIDKTTGFANFFDFRKITNNETRKKFFKSMNSIKYENGLYKFEFDYKNFDTYKKYLDEKTFCIESYGNRIKRFKNNDGYWSSKNIDLTKELNEIFSNYNINQCHIKDVILNDDKICSKVFDVFKLMVQLRNTDSNNDYLISPVKNKQGMYYNTNEKSNPDMEASYNIAIKAMLKIYQNKSKNEDYFDFYSK